MGDFNVGQWEPYREYSSQFLKYFSPGTIYGYYKLNEGEGLSVYDYATTTMPNKHWFSKVLWIKDEQYLTLCPEYLNPIYIGNQVCCGEDYSYEPTKESYYSALALPAPTALTWANDGTACFYWYTPLRTADTTPQVLFSYPPLVLKGSCNTGKYYFYIYHQSTLLYSNYFNADTNKWIAVCVEFKRSGSNTVVQIMYSTGLTPTPISTTVATAYNFAPTSSYVTLNNDASPKQYYFRRLMLVNFYMSATDMMHLYINNGQNISPKLTSWLMAYWPLTETDTFKDLSSSGHSVSRTGNSLGPSTRKNSYAIAPVSTTPATTPCLTQDCSPYMVSSSSSIGSILVYRCTDTRLIALDFGEKALQASLLPSYIFRDVALQMSSRVTKTRSTPISSLHGLITDDSAYQTYYPYYKGTITATYPAFTISMWIYKKSITSTCLFSVYSSSTNAPLIYALASDHISFVCATAACSTNFDFAATTFTTSKHILQLTPLLDSWHHVYAVFGAAISTTTYAAAMVDGSSSKFGTSTCSNPLATTGPYTLSLGIKLNAGLVPDTATIFDGYIRSFTLYPAEYTPTPTNFANPGLAVFYIARAYMQLDPSKCATTYSTSSCSFCDAYTSTCFPDYLHTQYKDSSTGTVASCSATCADTYHTNCGTATTCTSCPADSNPTLADACMSCMGTSIWGNTYTSSCLTCTSENSYYNSATGTCQCRPGSELKAGTCTPIPPAVVSAQYSPDGMSWVITFNVPLASTQTLTSVERIFASTTTRVLPKSEDIVISWSTNYRTVTVYLPSLSTPINTFSLLQNVANNSYLPTITATFLGPYQIQYPPEPYNIHILAPASISDCEPLVLSAFINNVSFIPHPLP